MLQKILLLILFSSSLVSLAKPLDVFKLSSFERYQVSVDEFVGYISDDEFIEDFVVDEKVDTELIVHMTHLALSLGHVLSQVSVLSNSDDDYQNGYEDLMFYLEVRLPKHFKQESKLMNAYYLQIKETVFPALKKSNLNHSAQLYMTSAVGMLSGVLFNDYFFLNEGSTLDAIRAVAAGFSFTKVFDALAGKITFRQNEKNFYSLDMANKISEGIYKELYSESNCLRQLSPTRNK